MEVEQKEIISPRELARSYSQQFRRLRRREVEKLVVMRQGKIESVVLRGDDYERLVNGRSG
jgi:hypothetical protein